MEHVLKHDLEDLVDVVDELEDDDDDDMELFDCGEGSYSCFGVGGVDSELRIAWRCRLIAMRRSGPWAWCGRILRLRSRL